MADTLGWTAVAAWALAHPLDVAGLSFFPPVSMMEMYSRPVDAALLAGLQDE